MLKRKLIAINTTIMLGVGSIFALPSVQAESITNLQSQKNQIQNERAGIQNEIENTEKNITGLQAELDKIVKQIARIDQAIKDNNAKIQDTKNEIAATTKEVEALKATIVTLEDKIEKRNIVLKDRAISIQENGGNVSYLEVLLGSSSFRDFVDRVGAVATFVEADQNIIEEHETDKEELEKSKAAVESKLAGLTEMKAELEGMMAQIEEQKQQADILKADLKEKENQNLALKGSLENKDQTLASQASAIQSDIEQQKKRQAEMAAAKKRAEKARLSTEVKKSTKATSSKPTKSASNKSTKESSSEEETVSTGNGNVMKAVTAGYKYIGNSVYVFGGGRSASDIANGRFDCSGFVHWAYSQAGIKLGSRGSANTDSLKNKGTRVSQSQMRAGDMVFFDTYKKDGHVGIYVGGGKFIGSQSSTGVAVASMTSGYWGEKFNGRVVRVN